MNTHAKSLDRLVARTMRQSQLHKKDYPESAADLKYAIQWINLARKFWAAENYHASDAALAHAKLMVRWAIEDKNMVQRIKARA